MEGILGIYLNLNIGVSIHLTTPHHTYTIPEIGDTGND
uniref:Uncharacterized protein n=1 Tax=Rhizobium phage LG08 TaxID=3129229 RepID=A0AAU8HY31_9CAUD